MAEARQVLRIAEALLQKEDLVDTILAVLQGPVSDYWESLVLEAIRDLEDRVDALGDEAISPVPDAITAEEGQDEALENLILALLGSLELRLSAPLPRTVQSLVRASAERLAQRGAALGGLTLPGARSVSPSALAYAEDDLALALRGRMGTRREQVREQVRQLVSSRSIRQVPIQRTRWREELTELLGVPSTRWLPVALDAWAVRWQSIGAVEAAVQAGVTLLRAVNPRDNRTTPFCFWVHGKIVSVADAVDQINGYVEAVQAGDAEAAEDRWRWLSSAQAKATTGQRELFANVGLPPYHAGCRTQVVPA